MRRQAGVWLEPARPLPEGYRAAMSKLIDESERILLTLQQDGMPVGKYPHFERAIEQAKAEYVDTSH